jgi:superfamily I DNA/RNA helicase
MPLPTPIGRQKEVLYLPAQGHIAVLGTAGSGKTTLAMLRAAYLSDVSTDHSGPTLLVTFNRALVTYLKYLASAELANVKVEHYHKFARGYLNSRGRMGDNAIVGPDERSDLITKAIAGIRAHGSSDHPLFSKSPEFIAEELRWISQHGIETIEEYRATPPELPGELNGETTLPLLWQILEEYHRQRNDAGKRYDWDDIAVAVRDELANDSRGRRYRHVIIDEGQDFSPSMIQSLVRAVPANGSVTFFGDVAQQIYGIRVSWRSAGLNLAGTPWLFEENYRNTKQIAELALALTKMPYYQGAADLVSPKAPKAAGPLPSLLIFPDTEQEIKFVVKQAIQLSQAGSVAILTVDHEVRRFFNSQFKAGTFTELKNDMAKWKGGSGLSIGTYHAAKGLEFDSVILPRLDDGRVPPPEDIQAFGELRARADSGRLLYVGITRARQGLILTCTGSQTILLPSDPKILPLLSP